MGPEWKRGNAHVEWIDLDTALSKKEKEEKEDVMSCLSTNEQNKLLEIRIELLKVFGKICGVDDPLHQKSWKKSLSKDEDAEPEEAEVNWGRYCILSVVSILVLATVVRALI